MSESTKAPEMHTSKLVNYQGAFENLKPPSDPEEFEAIFGKVIGDPSNHCQSSDTSSSFNRHPTESGDTTLILAADAAHRLSTQAGDQDRDSRKPRNNEALETICKGSSGSSESGDPGKESSLSLSEQEILELVRVLQQSARAGKSSVIFAVRTQALGEIEFRMSIAGKNIFVQARVESPKAAAILRSEASMLAMKLRDLGLNLGKFEIEETTNNKVNTSTAGNVSASRSKKAGNKEGQQQSIPAIHELGKSNRVHVTA